ncbi:MAG: hypothetical protein G01um10147_695 [Microgenomates group bacterium Gr01-1014_7]|nr:MAG: hypothetical protein G01um10147_695 [Microgenomates group bacterium Gr01-1014_7]
MERNRAVIICLSGGLNENDHPSDKMQARLDRTVELFQSGDFNAIITTSKGTFRDGTSHFVTEAEAANAYLITQKIDPLRILKEERSLDTVGNAYYTRLLHLEPRGWWEPTIITNEFHMPRVQFIFDRVLDGKYNPQYIEAPNLGMGSEELASWQRHEDEMLKFYEHLFTGVRKGDLLFLEDYIYHRNPAYTGIEDDEHHELTRRIQAIWAA